MDQRMQFVTANSPPLTIRNHWGTTAFFVAVYAAISLILLTSRFAPKHLIPHISDKMLSEALWTLLMTPVVLIVALNKITLSGSQLTFMARKWGIPRFFTVSLADIDRVQNNTINSLIRQYNKERIAGRGGPI